MPDIRDLDSRGAGSYQADLEAYRNIQAVLRGRATHDERSFEIQGRTLERMSHAELRELSNYFATQIRAGQGRGGIRAIGETASVTVPVEDSIYAYLRDFDLNSPTVTGQAIAANSMYEYELLPTTPIGSGLVLDYHLVTDFEGFIRVDSSDTYEVVVVMKFTKTFNNKTAVTKSIFDFRLVVNGEETVSLNDFNTRRRLSRMQTDADGNNFHYTQEDLNAGGTIQISLYFELFHPQNLNQSVAGSVDIMGQDTLLHLFQLRG